MLRFWILLFPGLMACPTADTGIAALSSQAQGPPTITFRQDGQGDFNGADEKALQEALNSLVETGGTVVFGPGRYVLHGTVFVPAGVTLRGCEEALFALPAPVFLAEAAPKGASELSLTSTEDFVERSLVQLLPPIGEEFFADGVTRDYRFTSIVRVEGNRLQLATPLQQDIPARSRVGYSNKLFKTLPGGNVVFENMSFDGGRTEAVPMPGHHLRTAVWVASPFRYGVGIIAPPTPKVTVRNCLFRNLYGRGVAFYNAVDCSVEGNVFEHIADEAIDFDHFCERGRAVGNDIRDVYWGIVLNDASDNLVEYNNVDGCKIGIWSWWYKEFSKEGLNERNHIRHNTIRGATEAAIHFDRFCTKNIIESNFIEGTLTVLEEDNTVRDNIPLKPAVGSPVGQER